MAIFRHNARIRSLFQVWLEMSHLDYCSANFLHVVGFCFFPSITKKYFDLQMREVRENLVGEEKEELGRMDGT